MTGIIHGCFNAIHLVPDQVLAWVGGHASGGHFGREVGNTAQGYMAAVVNRAEAKTLQQQPSGKSNKDPNKDVGAIGNGAQWP